MQTLALVKKLRAPAQRASTQHLAECVLKLTERVSSPCYQRAPVEVHQGEHK
jgi:hypothetical protein